MLRTRGQAIYRNHFLHHRYGGVSPSNLVLGADVLRLRTRTLTERALAVMAEIGMPPPPTSEVRTAHG